MPQLELNSPDGVVRATLGVESVWLGSTCYPGAAVWRIWHRGGCVVEQGVAGISDRRGVLGYGLKYEGVIRGSHETRFGQGRQLRALFTDSSGRALEVLLRVTGRSGFCAVRRVADDAGGEAEPWGGVEYVAGARLLGSRAVRELTGCEVRFSPFGVMTAGWRHGLEHHLVFFDRPGDLAEDRFRVCDNLILPPVNSGVCGCEHLFLSLPFSPAKPRMPEFGSELTPSFCEAFRVVVAGMDGGDDYWVVRGEVGEFGVVARRSGSEWVMAGITGVARMLTLRFEDLWWRTPAELRSERYSVEIRRDPIKGEGGKQVVEHFSGLCPESRVVVDLAESGGFVLYFRSERQGVRGGGCE